MSGFKFKVEQDDRKIRATITQLIALGRNPAAAMEDIAVIGENTTRERFATQIDPEGNRWKKSIRVQINGGKTLTKDGHLGDSITHLSNSKFAEWGSNRIYAAIHQFGGYAGRAIRRVNLVARAFIGISSADELDMLDALQARINGMINHAN
ncbi:MAG: phage virion morphogenesis protein [Methylotenera sp.]|nr:phage virion morphogenesis protein [Methylotenera sp.]